MQSRIFSKFIFPRPASVNSGFDLRRGVASLAVFLAAFALGDTARAQVSNPAPPTEQPSQTNPVPRAGSDAQNSNRAHDDKAWGATDANRRFYEIPFSRIPDTGAVARGNGRLVADGWQFPRLASQDPNRQGFDFGGEQGTGALPTGALATNPGVMYIGAQWASVNGTSTNFIGTNYQRTLAVPRPAPGIPDDTFANNPGSTVKWLPNITGAANVLRRFTIQVYLPTPEEFPEDGTRPTEGRVEDARYVVYYQVRNLNTGTIDTHRRIILRSQSGTGWVTLSDNNNQPILFPMATEATLLTGNSRPRVELDNTTEGDTSSEVIGGITRANYIVADQIRFIPSSEYGEIKAPTTVTPTHGGRRVDKVNPTLPLGAPYDPARSIYQPAWTAQPSHNPQASGAFTNDSFDFINNARQVVPQSNTTLYPNTGETLYTDPTSTFYQRFEPWNPSTLFQGPRSLIDDQTNDNTFLPGFDPREGVPPVRRTNQQRYEYTDPTFAGQPVPFFSQMQVLVPRTEYVPDPNSVDSLGSIAVGCVYAVDWLTGSPIWRFPDRTYLPRPAPNNSEVPGALNSYVDPYGVAVAGSGLRNPNIFQNGNAVPTVPGIGAFDRNGDGYISDDEVYIVGQGGNSSGGIEAGITLVPRIYTRGNSSTTLVPFYDDNWSPYTALTPALSSNLNTTSIRGIVRVPDGRYASSDATPAPVEAGMAIIASNNGVIYAIDPYGNNDNRYYTAPDVPDANGNVARFGTFRNGSTNALWTFSVTAPVRQNTDTNQSYNLKLKQSVPATGPWGHSTPVIAYAKEDTDVSLSRFAEEPRLFIGNTNGVLYAINAVADAGAYVEQLPATVPPTYVYQFGSFPFRKETHRDPNSGGPGGPPDLRWWFETEAAITAAPAVSSSIHPVDPSDTTPKAKGVYVTSNDGRVYSLDWNGPVTGVSHTNNLNYDGTTAGAELLNDNFRFHNANAITEFARADGTEGTIRPRWVFPSRYRDLNGDGNNSELAPVKPADDSNVSPGFRVERQTRLAPINSAPSLMDYPFFNPVTNQFEIKRYVVVVANDLNGSDAPIRGRVYLLNQIGDRRDFSVKTVTKTAAQAGGVAVAFGQPDDMWAPTEFSFSDATPAWTYRPIYKRYNDTTGTDENVQFRNRPGQLFVPATGTVDLATDVSKIGLPEKRNLPTVFVGGPSGRVFGLDIDAQTGLFLRWRGSIQDTRKNAGIPLPQNYTDAVNLPANEPVNRRLDPPNPVLQAATTADLGIAFTARPPLVRTYALLNADDVASITVSGGPQQNRNHPYATPAPVNGPTVPGLPTNNTPSLVYPGVPYVLGNVTNPPPAGIVPIIGVRPPFWTKPNVDAAAAGTAPDFTAFPLVNVSAFDSIARFVNQDHDDPIATTRGSYAFPPTIANPGVIGTSPADTGALPGGEAANRAYQYPLLAVTTTDGSFTLLSTELDGLDSDPAIVDPANPNSNTTGQGGDAEAVMGWATSNDPRRANPIRTLMLSLRGPGGPGTQIALVTNAYYAAMDPGFRNTVQKLAAPYTDPAGGTSPADASVNFPTYPWYQPTNVGVIGASPFDDPRPRFEPRSLYSGNTASDVGPDGVATTGDGWPETKADAHTGRTGLPLDLRGLFYDKRFAANTTDNNTNDDGLVRLPAYTGIGEALPLANRRGRNRQVTQFLSMPSDIIPPTGATYAPLADGVPDVPRDTSTGATSPYRTDPFKLFAGDLDPADTAIRPEADINPPGTNIAWMFMGGADGVFYAYTPNRYSVPGFGGGVGSGFAGGGDNGNRAISEGLYGNAKLLLISEATYNALLAAPGRPDPATAGLLTAGGKPFYEYGENIYAVIYDIGPNYQAFDLNRDGVITEGPEATYPTSINVAFRPYTGNTARSAQTGNTGATVLIPAQVIQAPAGSTTYPYDFDPLTQLSRPQDPALVNQPTSKRKIALLRVQVNTNFNQGGAGGGRRTGAASVGWTPGVIYEMTASGISGPGVGATEREVIANQNPLITIANPLAVQAFLLSNEGAQLAQVADPANSNRVYNSIGPFESSSAVAGDAPKTHIATAGDLSNTNPTGADPDRLRKDYSQALTNGNSITRFDLEPGTATVRNVNYGKPFSSGAAVGNVDRTYEPSFYIPVAASAGMIDPAKSGSTNVTNTKRTLRIVNRSLQGNLSKLRVELRSDALFRSWPGNRPNVRPNDGTVGYNGPSGVPTELATLGTGNPRLTPLAPSLPNNAYAMRPDGIVNYMPWEQPMVASLPWERDTTSTGLVAALSNSSRDYPDIAAQSDVASTQKAVQVIAGSNDVVRSPGNLTASVGTGVGRSNLSVGELAIRTWNYAGNTPNFTKASASVEIKVPQFQPANLVAMHSLTSTYVKPSSDEAPGDLTADGDIQLPRTTVTNLDRASTDRALRLGNLNSSAGTGDTRTITPMGYTLQMRAYIDINGDGTWDATEPYRDFETWFGVPVDIAMDQQGTTVELPGSTSPTGNSGFSMGFGQQNGYLGYNLPGSGLGGRSIGFLPPFLQDAANIGDPYDPFFARFTVQSKSNVNLWNVRASQKIERFNNGNDPTDIVAGDGKPYNYFAMQSDKVESRFGILAAEADPLATNPMGIMPNVVTSLDPKFDSAWNNLFNSNTANAVGLFGTTFNPLRIPVAAGGQTRYQAYYAQFLGRHTLHKPLPTSTENAQGSVLSVPDVPAGSLPGISPGPIGSDPNFPPAGTFLPPVQGRKPALGVAVPLGTPSGEYSNNISGTPLAFFEDHDTPTGTNNGVNNVPIYLPLVVPSNATNNSITLRPAGPLYGGQDALHPGQLPANSILPSGSEGILRPRSYVGLDPTTNTRIYEYLPSTTVTTDAKRVAFDIHVRVNEAPLTGQIADQALAVNGFPAAVVNGLLPSIDDVPLFDVVNIAAGGTARPISSLAPAAYRMGSGNMVLFYNSNASTTGGPDARPGAPFNLFSSLLTWNAGEGTWQADALRGIGKPIDGTQIFDSAQNQGGWFSARNQLTIGNAPNESNVSPFVLQDPLLQGGLANAEATLFVMNVVPTSNGEAQYSPYFASLGTNVTSTQLSTLGFTSLLARTGNNSGNNRIDPTLRRFNPRAVYVPTTSGAPNAVFVMYYGGTTGNNNLLYVAAPATASGGIDAAGLVAAQNLNQVPENLLRLPAAVTAASDPMPITRVVRIKPNGQGVWVYDPSADLQYVVDVHYTAVLRGGGSSDVVVSRYRVVGNGVGARLQPIDLPRQVNESLVSSGRAPVFHAKHLGWYNRINGAGDPASPIISIVDSVTKAVVSTDATKWQIDNATKLLFQTITLNTKPVVVYVDTSAGIVTFRGSTAPTAGQEVRATYLPLAYRIAGTDAVEASTFGFMDRRPVNTAVASTDGIVIGATFSGVQLRYRNWDNSGGQGIDREWLYWQRSNQSNQPASLYFTTRRVGVDLKALGILAPNESLKLDPNLGVSVNPLQTVLVDPQVPGLPNIPYEVDFAEGKIYTQANLEGLPITITGFKTTNDPGVPAVKFTVDATLSPIDEITGKTDTTNGTAVPMAQRVNENQPYAFLDLYDGRGPANPRTIPAISPDAYPQTGFDPALQPGKVWLFWSSARGRSGLARVPAAPATYQSYFNIPAGEAITASGYDLFWQTLAPPFDSASFTGFP